MSTPGQSTLVDGQNAGSLELEMPRNRELLGWDALGSGLVQRDVLELIPVNKSAHDVDFAGEPTFRPAFAFRLPRRQTGRPADFGAKLREAA